MSSARVEMSPVVCPICGHGDGDVLYEGAQPVSGLGDVPIRLLLCSGCGLLYTNPQVASAAMRGYYAIGTHTSGLTYRDTGRGTRHDRLTRERLEFVDRHRRGEVLLDIGAGVGDFLAAVLKPGLRTVGLEPSRRAVSIAEARGFEMLHGSIEDLAADATARFGTLVMFSVLEHVRDPKAAVAMLVKLLAPEGVAIIEVPDSERPYATIGEFFGFEHLWHFTPESLPMLLAAHGLRVLDVQRSHAVRSFRLVAATGPSSAPMRCETAAVRAAVMRYAAERASLVASVVERLRGRAERWQQEGHRVAIYGAGEHTRCLLGHMDFGNALAYFVDSDPSKQGTNFLEKPVVAPEALKTLPVSAVVISSHDFEDEIERKIAKLGVAGLEVIRLYG